MPPSPALLVRAPRPALAVATALAAAGALVLALVLALVVGLGGPTAPAQAVEGVTTTQVTTVRPVTHAGEPAPGWSVERESGSVDCDGAAPSSTARGIAACYPTAIGVRACFLSSHRTVLCLRDVAGHRLVRLAYTGDFPSDVAAPPVPQPLRATLTDGDVCLARVGGAWSSPPQRPSWVGFASCARDGGVYGPGSGDGVDRSRQPWRVWTWAGGRDDRLRRREVARGYVVGYAREP